MINMIGLNNDRIIVRSRETIVRETLDGTRVDDHNAEQKSLADSRDTDAARDFPRKK